MLQSAINHLEYCYQNVIFLLHFNVRKLFSISVLQFNRLCQLKQFKLFFSSNYFVCLIQYFYTYIYTKWIKNSIMLINQIYFSMYLNNRENVSLKNFHFRLISNDNITRRIKYKNIKPNQTNISLGCIFYIETED